MQLQRGEKRGLADLGIASTCTVKVDFGLDGVDIAAFGLNKDGKIAHDGYVVLFSNTRTPEGAVVLSLSSDSAVFQLQLDSLPAEIDRIVFTATHDSRPISESSPLIVRIDGNKATFNVAEHLTNEKAVMMIETYRHSSGWRVGAIASGFAGGLASLIQHLGGQVSDQATSSGKTSSPANAAPPQPSTPGPSPTIAAPPVSLSKVTLQKSNPTVSLKKTGETFGEIILNLNWNQRQKRGFFGGGGAVDLDLGVLFELRDGFKGCIQALGRNFGSFQEQPWIELSGDDRTGAVADGETIRVNGRHFDKIKRLGVFALIYDGAPNWQQTDGIVRMNIPGQPEIEVRMDEGQNNRRLCGVALIDNVNGGLQMQRHMKYYPSQKEFADAIGIILRWTAGTKD